MAATASPMKKLQMRLLSMIVIVIICYYYYHLFNASYPSAGIKAGALLLPDTDVCMRTRMLLI